MTSPVTSTSVATNGADALAGSKPEPSKNEGQHRAGERSKRHDADEREEDRQRDL